MCGRYGFTKHGTIFDRLSVVLTTEEKKLGPNYNVSPGQFMPIIICENGKNVVKNAKWGVIPAWAKDSKIGYKLFNTRDDSVLTKPMWRNLFAKKRCLVPASGFYEWRKEGNKRIPHYFHLKDHETFSFAGLYEVLKDAEGMELYSYSIITTDANDTVAHVHHRMPVILDEKEENVWLDTSIKDLDMLKNMLDPLEVEKMEFYKVTEEVNKPANNYPGLLYPLKT